MSFGRKAKLASNLASLGSKPNPFLIMTTHRVIAHSYILPQDRFGIERKEWPFNYDGVVMSGNYDECKKYLAANYGPFDPSTVDGFEYLDESYQDHLKECYLTKKNGADIAGIDKITD